VIPVRMFPPFNHGFAEIERVCGATAAQYASNKSRGGLAGQKGWTFEVLYAAYRIATEAYVVCSRGGTGAEVWFQAQAGGFVDDLAVVTLEETILSQTKSGDVSWTAGEHPLAEDFRLQATLDNAAGRSATYELVVATDEVAASIKARQPSDVAFVRVAIFRAAGPDLLGLFERQQDLAHALDGISLRPPRRIVREQTFEAILGAWVRSGGAGCLRDILRELAVRPYALVRVPGPDFEVRAEVAEALYGVPGFRFRTVGMHFQYEVADRLSGWAAFLCDSEGFRAFEQFIMEGKPTRWVEVVDALRKEG